MDRLANEMGAAERERYVRYAAGKLHVRQVLLDPARRLDEVDAVVVVFLDAGRDREDVRIENDVFGRKADLFDEDFVRARADILATLQIVGLALLVERHHHRGGAVRSEEHTSELQSLLRNSYAVFCLKNKNTHKH